METRLYFSKAQAPALLVRRKSMSKHSEGCLYTMICAHSLHNNELPHMPYTPQPFRLMHRRAAPRRRLAAICIIACQLINVANKGVWVPSGSPL